MSELDADAVVATLNEILEQELAGVARLAGTLGRT